MVVPNTASKMRVFTSRNEYDCVNKFLADFPVHCYTKSFVWTESPLASWTVFICFMKEFVLDEKTPFDTPSPTMIENVADKSPLVADEARKFLFREDPLLFGRTLLNFVGLLGDAVYQL